MEKVSYFECIARCDAGGKLQMSAGMTDAVIRGRQDYIYELDGAARYRELLSLGAFCEEFCRDREAMDAYMLVVDNVMIDKYLRLANGGRRRLYMQAAEGLMRLCCSADEVVWEICTQVCDRWRDEL